MRKHLVSVSLTPHFSGVAAVHVKQQNRFNGFRSGLVALLFLPALLVFGADNFAAPPVSVFDTAETFTLSNSLLTAEIEKRTGTLLSLKYEKLELIAQTGGGANGGYWSSVGRG